MQLIGRCLANEPGGSAFVRFGTKGGWLLRRLPFSSFPQKAGCFCQPRRRRKDSMRKTVYAWCCAAALSSRTALPRKRASLVRAGAKAGSLQSHTMVFLHWNLYGCLLPGKESTPVFSATPAAEEISGINRLFLLLANILLIFFVFFQKDVLLFRLLFSFLHAFLVDFVYGAAFYDQSCGHVFSFH